MHIKKYIFGLLLFFCTPLPGMEQRVFSQEARAAAHVQAVLAHAYTTAAKAPTARSVHTPIAQPPLKTPILIRKIRRRKIIQASPIPYKNYGTYRDTPVNKLVVVPVYESEKTDSYVTPKSAKKAWLTRPVVIVGIGCIVTAIIMLHVIDQIQKKQDLAQAIAPLTPVVYPAPTGGSIQTAWDIAYLRLPYNERSIIDSIQLHNQYVQYAKTLKGTLQERQELTAVIGSINPADIVHEAFNTFIQCYKAYEQEQSNTALAQSVVTTHQRLLILYYYFKKR